MYKLRFLNVSEAKETIRYADEKDLARVIKAHLKDEVLIDLEEVETA